jgi:uncharacterized membrane protein YfcA
MDWPLVIAFGLCVGILVGTTGIGGGSLMTPLLILVLGTAPTTAIGTDLAYAAVTKTVGGWRHWRRGSVDMGIALWLAVGSIPGALGGVQVLSVLEKALGGEEFDTFLLVLVGAALLVTGMAVLARALFLSTDGERHTVVFERRHKIAAVAIGVSVGFVLGLTSAGSGALIAVGLILVFRLTPLRVVGTDVFHAAIMLWAAGLALVFVGNIDWGLMGTILIGSLPGVWIGEHLSRRVPAAALRPALGCVMLGSALGVASKAGADLSAWAIIGPPVLIGLVAYVLQRVWVREVVPA